VVVVIVLFSEGETAPRVLDDTMRDVSGDRSGALVDPGSAIRVTAACFGLLFPRRVGSAMRPTALGVGVAGGGVAGGGTVSFLARRLGGVEGASACDNTSTVTFLFRDGVGGGGIASAGSPEIFFSGPPLSRADLLVAIARTAIKFQC